MKKDKKTNETSVACKNKKKTCMELDYWGQKQKKLHAANYLTLARLGRLLPQRLAEFRWDGHK